MQRVAPIFDLGVAREEQLLLAHLEKQDKTRVVHLVVERAHDFEKLLRREGSDVIAEPARLGGHRFLALRARAWFYGRNAHRLQATLPAEQLPEFVRVARALFADLVRLRKVRRAQYMYLHSRQQGLKTGVVPI